MLQQPNARKDEDQAENDGTKNAPLEHWPLASNKDIFDNLDHRKANISNLRA